MGSKPKAPAPSKEERALLKMQLEEKQRLKSQVEQKKEAMRRGRLGRRSLLSGEARGVVEGRDRQMKPEIPEEQLARSPEPPEKGGSPWLKRFVTGRFGSPLIPGTEEGTREERKDSAIQLTERQRRLTPGFRA
jgi:hypothetical protein